MKFKNKYAVEGAVCNAFVCLGLLAGVNVGRGTGPEDLDEDLTQACYEANFGDPHFLGGPTCIIRIDSHQKIEKVFSAAFTVADRLIQYISKTGDRKKVQMAQQHRAVIDAAHCWLTFTVDGRRQK